MQNIFRKLQRNKPLLFGLYGAIGCLIAALLLGEPLLALTKLAPSTPQAAKAVVLLIDASGSMSDGKLTEVKSAATNFVERRNLKIDQVGVVSFGLEITTASPLTGDTNALKNAIATLSENGGTPMAEGIDQAVAELQSTDLRRNILLFTDGVPNSASLASLSAQSARNQRINLIAVATGDADINYLAQLTGDRDLVFYANSGQFDQAFRNAEAAIYKQLVESSPTGDYGVVYSSLRIGGWTAFLAMGISLALIMGQNSYMHLPLLTFRKGAVSTVGSLAAGMVAGAAGQLLFVPLTNVPIPAIVAGIMQGSVASACLTVILSLIIPKLKLTRAIVGGGLSGALSAGAWLITAGMFGDLFGRIAGAIVFSICIQVLAGSYFGLVAGLGVLVFGQLLFLPISAISILELMGRIIGWAILGILVGGGTRFFVPNLQLNKALFGGTVGGVIGAIGFLVTAGVFGDILGRLSGAAILGFCIGWMIAFAEQEQLRQEPYLLVHWTPTEQTQYLLGIKPFLIGSSREANIPLNASEGFTPITAKIYKEGEKIMMNFNQEYAAQKNMKKTTQELKVGDKRVLGKITIEVKSKTNQKQS
ncbi:VWA domain-containing protein [Nostoc sp. FACHB-87]|uniref:VWA domain-containing protein n=1 Tax=Nostocaceae TaxID=1162 RepID=UPI00168372B1|nr:MULTISPECIES: VWA domain-containing protein [Nostocaceae]MBD2456686.1 VWA domain-containing protein [Nostoc sp. FACHB-87]MBD2478060.1 VWA domain-containing protein [Anabaena sp. FACHB-83]